MADFDEMRDAILDELPSQCPDGHRDLREYDHGCAVACDKCLVYYERGAWRMVACDENHAHGWRCLTKIDACEEA